MKTKPRKDKRGRVLRTSAERGELVKAYETSTLRQAEFCAQRGIHPTTFSSWWRAAQNTAKRIPRDKVEFAEFNMPVGGAAPIEIVLPDRVTIRVRDAALCKDLLPLLRGYASC